MPTQIADANLVVNSDNVGYMPNTLKFSEGLGEQTVRAVSDGGGSVSQVFANNLESAFARVSFELPVTAETIALVRGWKLNGNSNVVQILASTPEGRMTRTFNRAALITDYDVEIGADTNISVEFQTAKAA